MNLDFRVMKILGVISLLSWAFGTCFCWASFMQYITYGDKRGARRLLSVGGVLLILSLIVSLIFGKS